MKLLLQARKQPTTQAQVIEYLLSTETGEMQYETARCRPQLDDSFFAYLDSQIGESDVHCTQEKMKVCLMHNKHIWRGMYMYEQPARWRSPRQYYLQTQHNAATALLQHCAYADKMTSEELSVLIADCVLQLSRGLRVP